MFLIFFLLPSYNDIALDSKNRVVLLNRAEKRIEIPEDSILINLDSIKAPEAIDTSPFSIWVTSTIENKTLKYSLEGAYLGNLNFGGRSLDVTVDRLLFCGDRTLLFYGKTGRKVIVNWKRFDRCALSGDSIYLYVNDSLYVLDENFKRTRLLEMKGLKDIDCSEEGPVYLFSDSLKTSRRTVDILGGRRVAVRDRKVLILGDSGISEFKSESLFVP